MFFVFFSIRTEERMQVDVNLPTPPGFSLHLHVFSLLHIIIISWMRSRPWTVCTLCSVWMKTELRELLCWSPALLFSIRFSFVE